MASGRLDRGRCGSRFRRLGRLLGLIGEELLSNGYGQSDGLGDLIGRLLLNLTTSGSFPMLTKVILAASLFDLLLTTSLFNQVLAMLLLRLLLTTDGGDLLLAKCFKLLLSNGLKPLLTKGLDLLLAKGCKMLKTCCLKLLLPPQCGFLRDPPTLSTDKLLLPPLAKNSLLSLLLESYTLILALKQTTVVEIEAVGVKGGETRLCYGGLKTRKLALSHKISVRLASSLLLLDG
jgi:hypothetical protein